MKLDIDKAQAVSLNIDELKAAALAATPGEWLYRTDPGNPTGFQHCVRLPGEFGAWVCDCLDNADKLTAGGIAGERNAAYIAAANPTVVLSLIVELEQLRAARSAGLVLAAAPPAPVSADVAHGSAEEYLRGKYGAYRGHFAWRELEEAFNAGRASPVSAELVPIPAQWLKPGAVVPVTADTERMLLDAVRTAPPAPAAPLSDAKEAATLHAASLSEVDCKRCHLNVISSCGKNCPVTDKYTAKEPT